MHKPQDISKEKFTFFLDFFFDMRPVRAVLFFFSFSFSFSFFFFSPL